jgi:hypothetical protein
MDVIHHACIWHSVIGADVVETIPDRGQSQMAAALLCREIILERCALPKLRLQRFRTEE